MHWYKPSEMLDQLKHSRGSPRSVRGFTLIELMVTLAILALLASLAAPSYRSFLINQQLGAVSSDFLVSILQARSEAIRQGRIVAVLPTLGNTVWTNGWELSVVSNSCVRVGDAFGMHEALNPMVSINAATTGAFAHTAPFYAYSATGFPFLCPGYTSFANGTLALQAVETGRERRVVVSNSGRARMCDPSKETC